MRATPFPKLLRDSSGALLECATKVENGLRRVLDIADTCKPELALVVADSLTKLTRDIGAAPIFFAETTGADGDEMRSIIEVLAVVLKKAMPYEAKTDDDIEAAVELTKNACDKHELPKGVRKLFVLLVREIAKVYMELREVLKRSKKDGPTKKLHVAVQNYMRRTKQAILCFAYNSMKLRVCLKSIDQCGASSHLDKKAMVVVVKNIYLLSRKTRTMAVLAPYHHDNIKKTLALIGKRAKLADNSD